VPLLDTDVTPGSVTVSLRGGPQGFRGSFLIEEAMVDGGAAASAFLKGIFAESLPQTPRVEHYGYLQARALVDAFLRAGGWTAGSSDSHASVFPLDCHYTAGANVQVEVAGADSRTRVTYLVAGLPSLSADRTTTAAADALTVSFLPATAVELIARDADSQKIVARYRHVAAPSTYLFLSRLFPLSAEDECSGRVAPSQD
jgi:hypothetical protein